MMLASDVNLDEDRIWNIGFSWLVFVSPELLARNMLASDVKILVMIENLEDRFSGRLYMYYCNSLDVLAKDARFG